MRQDKKKKVISVVAVIIIIMLVATMMLPVLYSNAESIDSQYSELQKKQKELEQQQADLEEKIKSNESDQIAIKKQLENISQNMDTIKQQIDFINNKIEDCNAKISQKNKEIALTQKRITDNTELYKKRICTLYEAGSVSRVQVLLSSKSITDFLTRYEIIRMISDHDNNLIKQLINDKKTVENDKKTIESQKKELVAQQATLKAKESTYEAQETKSKRLFSQLKDKNAQLKAQNDAIDAAEKAANEKLSQLIRQKQEEARRKAAERRNSSGKSSGKGGSSGSSSNSSPDKYVGGDWLWPIQDCPGQYISSPFGPREGHTYPHTGIDIAAGGIAGHPILAANNGTVIIVDHLHRIYGNYVVIDHGGGISTLYGHCRSLSCSVGQKVTRGQVIAYVGNTGNVTNLGGGGYHLHFQIEINGTPVNPLNYVKRP